MKCSQKTGAHKFCSRYMPPNQFVEKYTTPPPLPDRQ